MLNFSRVTIAAALTTLFSASVFASADFVPKAAGNADNGKKIFVEGKGEVPACVTCHGEKGLGEDSMGTPRLAGQGYNFLVKQLSDFAADKRMDTTMGVMNNNAKGLTPQEHQDVAAYLSSLNSGEISPEGSDLEAVKGLGVPVGQTHLGKSIAVYGAPERGIPACHSCHGFNGRGAFPIYPALSGQKYVYLVNQLKKWREESRANDMMGQMRAVAKKMTDDDIHNVAAYLTNADRTTMGNYRTPQQRH
jgi:cytochrome c553